jgi:hypothetical protein
VHVVHVVHGVHEPHVDEGEHDELHLALLGELGSEREFRDVELVEPVHEQDAAAVGHDEPDRKQDRYEAQVLFPVDAFSFFTHDGVPLMAV